MSRKTYMARAGAWSGGIVAGLLALVVVPSLAAGQSVDDKYRMARDRQSLFNLSSGPTVVLQVNKFQCGLINNGSTCTDVFNSPTGGGGFWPTGTPNQYMFNSGLQVVGIIPQDAGFDWAGDTVGSFFMDAAGTRLHGTAVTEIYNSLDADDLANWPDIGAFGDFPDASAWVTDTALFNDVLIGRRAASQQDSWSMYWDGDPGPTGGRDHPMGILVEQRTLAWNYPTGNEAIIYFIYKFTNVTNNALFQRLNETRFFGGENRLPDAGWRFDSLYVAFDSDPDVTADFNKNYATGIFPFNLGLSYEGTFFEPAFDYPPSEFYPPFFTSAPGIVGIKYLKSPVDPATGEEVGLTSLSLHTNGGAFPDPNSVQRGWRYISLNIDAGKGDPNCTFPVSEIKQRKACFLSQTQSDVRFFIGSGPFSLDAGQSATIAVAMFAAATVATPTIQTSNTADNKPGIPSLQPGCNGNPIRPIEIASGWVRSNNCPGDPNEQLSQENVDVVPNSLLGKANVAQAIFDNKFLLGFAPETPEFYLVPGDNQITVVWEPSPTEDAGDPFFAAAGDPNSPLFDPNYRQFDVEGYRIYRGTTPANLQMIAQFDKSGSTFTDNLCVTDPTFVTGDDCTEVHEVELVGDFVQYPPGGVVRLADGSTLIVRADTALAAERVATPPRAEPLSDTGIPFAFVDNGVRNGFQYFYRVTAFDINSLRAGPSSLESAGGAKSAAPRKAAPNQVIASFNSSIVGKDGVALNPNAPMPMLDAENGTFSGPMPPTNGAEALFAPLIERLLPAFRLSATIDSVVGDNYITGCPATGGSAGFGSCWHLYMTFDRDGQRSQSHVEGWTPVWSSFDGTSETEFTMASAVIPADPTSLAAFGIADFDFTAVVSGNFHESIRYSAFEGQHNRRFGSSRYAGGSRWFDGPNETLADPTTAIRVGTLAAVDTVWAPIHHTPVVPGGSTYAGSGVMQCFGYGYSGFGRAADVEFTWGNGAFASVVDVTHNVDVPFKPNVQTSYGFLNHDADGDGVISYADFHYIENISPLMEDFGFCAHTDDPSTYVQLEQTPQLVPVSIEGDNPGDIDQTGMGFALYVNGERFIFQASQLPANGTVWTLRTYAGNLSSSDGDTDDPSGYAFAGLTRPPLIPGLTFVWESETATAIVGEAQLDRVHTVPDPYYAVSQFDLSPASKELKFVNLPAQATIRIYSMSGVLVDILTHDDATGGGFAPWDLRNRSNQFVASGVYFYHVSTPDGNSRVGKFTVVNSGFAR